MNNVPFLQVSKYTNMKRIETLRLMIDLAESLGNVPCDMLVVCILSHGTDQGKFLSSDCCKIDTEVDVFRLRSFYNWL